MKKQFLRYLLTSIFLLCCFSLLISCGSGDDDEVPPVGSITLCATQESIPADGYSSVAITATLTDSLGAPVEQGTSVVFSTTLGSFSNGSTSMTVITPDTSGAVTISLMSGRTPGSAQVTVSGSGVTQRIYIKFTHAGNTGVPVGEEFALYADYYNISGLWVANLEDKVMASVGDVYGNAVQDSTLVNFKTYNTGGFFTPDSSATLNGFVTSSLFSTAGPVPMQGFVSTTAETEGGPTTRVTSIEVTPVPDNHIIYAGTDGGGVYKSTDSGTTWETISRSSLNPRRGENWIDPYIKGHSAICVDPDDHNAIYAGTGYLGKGNVFRSLDGGMNWNSNNVEEWNGLYNTNTAVLTVLCDGDDKPATDYPYVWIGTEGKGILYSTDGESFQPSGGAVSPHAPTAEAVPGVYTNPLNTGDGTMSKPTLSYSSKTETWTATCFVPSVGSATMPLLEATGTPPADGWMSNVTTSGSTKTEDWTVTYKGVAGQVSTGGDWQGTVTPLFPTVEKPGTPPFYMNPNNTGNGTMTQPTLYGGTAKNEDWTATYDVTAARTSTPVLDTSASGSGADGTIADLSATITANAENWTLTYTGGYNNDVTGGGGNGTLTVTSTSASTETETWTVICSDATQGAEKFQVIGSVSGVNSEYDISTGNYKSDHDEVSFFIICTSGNFKIGDQFTFSTTQDGWTVVGSVSGAQQHARTDVEYTSNNSEITFTIKPGANHFYMRGDRWTFKTTLTGEWRVQGTVSGEQTERAENGKQYSSDNNEVTFTIEEGTPAFSQGDAFTFNVAVSGTWGNGTVIGIDVKRANASTETWTLTCYDASTPGSELFRVVSNVAGVYPDATVGTDYDEAPIAFKIIPSSQNFAAGDTLSFTITTFWRAAGTASGVQLNTATTGVYYVSSGSEVGFTIYAGATLFSVGDKFTFSTSEPSSPFWFVQGDVSGLQSWPAQNGVLYHSDNYEVSFLITEGFTPFATGDTFAFDVTANDVGHGRTVWDLVKVPNTHGGSAVLYAGTATGVFRSTNGGQTWTEPGNFTGDYVISLALHPKSTGGVSDVIYAGTQNGAVWVSTNSGTKWTRYSSGMEAGAFIRDVLLDPTNNFLYAVTYEGPIDKATGNVYAHALNPDGSMARGVWSEANTGLSGVALHAMAIDDPAKPAALYTGGEGINLYKATNGLSSGDPSWKESKDGLSNLIMARMPILFSGACSLDVRRVTYENTVYFTIYLQDLNGNPPITGSKFTATYTPEEGDEMIFYDLEYPDCYTHQGTFRDPGNAFTNNPYYFYVSVSPGDEIEIIFEPANTLPNAPGSSGSKQTLTYKY